MKKLLVLFFFALSTPLLLIAEGIEFFHGTWEEALEKSKSEEKPIFVDAYAVWCGPCKRMAREVFTRQDVGDFYNANFINLKLDMEAEENLTFRSKYPVSAFPTLFYIDSKGEVLKKVKGAQRPEGFIKLGESVLSSIDYSVGYAQTYEEGERDPEFILKYIESLNKSNKSSLKVANDYLKNQDNLSTVTNQKIIFAAVTEADSRIFDMLIEQRSAIEKLVGKEAVAQKIEAACEATVQKAIEFEFDGLLEEANQKMKEYLPEKADRFALIARMNFCLAMGDAQQYAECCKDYVKKEAKNDDKKLHQLASEMVAHFSDDAEVMKQAEKLAKKAIQKNDKVLDYHLTYALILLQNGKQSEALKVANSSMELAKATEKRKVKNIIKRIEG